jgi:polysaccharide biosynthesis protein PslH
LLMKILFISRWFPYPPDNGSKLRVHNLLRGLSKEHEITLLSFSDRPEIDKKNSEILKLCKQVSVVPWKAYNPKSRRALWGYFSPQPRSVKDTFSQEMATKIQQILATERYDCVIASQSDAARYRGYFCELPAVFEEIELGVFYESYSQAGRIKDKICHGFTWLKHKNYISSLARNFNACTVVSEEEKCLVSRILPEYQAVKVIPNCINLADYEHILRQPEPGSIVFTGSFRYFANYNAMVWFIKEVLPIIQKKIGDVKVIITGDHANLPLPPTHDVTLTGFVDDIHLLIANSLVSIAPIFQGGGTRLKILEAMALRTPVVATSKGAQGLEVVPGEHLLIADSAVDFAHAIIMIISDTELSQRLADNAYQLVQEKYDWQVVMPSFLSLVQKVSNHQEVFQYG